MFFVACNAEAQTESSYQTVDPNKSIQSVVK